MSVLCPTVLADSAEEYNEQIEVVRPFADRIQVDLGDGRFTTRSVGIDDIWWPEGMAVDIHLMYQEPQDHLATLVALRPELVILHAEASGDIESMIDFLHEQSIGAGVALLQETTVASTRSLIERADHVLLFSGSLGSFGGSADLRLLGKVPEIRALRPDIEIGWDGGANEQVVGMLKDGGIDVINVGGAIQKASHPQNAYRSLLRALNS